jgi:hypothetical protein
MAAFVIMRCFILPTAQEELKTLTGHRYHLDELILWHPEEVTAVLSGYSVRARALYTATELTAGAVDTLLTLGFWCVLLGYVLVRLRSSRRWKTLFVFPVVAALADLSVKSGVIYLLNTYPGDSPFITLWIRVFCVIRLVAYGSLIAGFLYVLIRHFVTTPLYTSRAVNSS